MAAAPPVPFALDLTALAGSMVTSRDDPDSLSLADLLEPGRLSDLLTRHHASTGGLRCAAASLWSQACLNTLLIPALTFAAVPGGAGLPGPETWRVSFCAKSGLAKRLVLHRGGNTPDLDPARALAVALGRHIVPFAAAVAAEGGLARRVVWDNLGYVLAWTLDCLGGAHPQRRNEASRLVEAMRRSEIPEQVAAVLDAAASGNGYRRRTCCLRYALPGYEHCATICPIASRPGRHEC